MTINRGTTLESFATAGDWTVTGSAGTPALVADTTNVREGAANLMMATSATTGSWCQMVKTVAWDLSAMTNIACRFYCEPGYVAGSVRLRLSVDAGVTKYFEVGPLGPTPGWNDYVFDKASFAAVGGAVAGDWASIIRCVVRQTANTGEVAHITPDHLSREYQGIDGRGVVCITVDDGRDSGYDWLWAEMQSRDLRWTEFCHMNAIGSAGIMTAAKLAELYADGVDIACHSMSHTNYTTLTAAQYAAEMSQARDTLRVLGFTDSCGYQAYPYGGYNAAVVAEAARWYGASRIVSDVWKAHTQPDDNAEHYIGGYQTDSVTPANLLAVVDKVINARGFVSFMFHDFVTTVTGGSQYSKTNMQTFLDGLVTRVQAGTLWVPTWSEYWRRMDRLHGRDPSWKRLSLYPKTRLRWWL